MQLVLNKTAYPPGSSAIVTIENGLGVKITVTDHHTDCTYVQLEHFVGGWQLVAPCRRQIATRLVNLAPGSATPQTIGIPTGPGAAGTYQVVLTYNNTLVVSPTFTVG